MSSHDQRTSRLDALTRSRDVRHKMRYTTIQGALKNRAVSNLVYRTKYDSLTHDENTRRTVTQVLTITDSSDANLLRR